MADFPGTLGEDTHFGDAGDDSIAGLGGSDLLAGEGGNDTLSGGDDHDTLDGGLGNDLIDGGDGFDRVIYAGAAAGVTVDLGVQGVGQESGLGDDTLIGIEAVSGTAFNDTLTGDEADNWLWTGSDGAGQVGDDVVWGGDGNDLIVAGAGNHDLNGEGGDFDTLSFQAAPIGPDVTALDIADNVYVSLQGDLWMAPQVTGQGHMYIRGFENLSGSSFDDWLEGDEGANVLAGWHGADRLEAADGDDLLLGDGVIELDADGQTAVYENEGAGDDTLEGGRGNDTLEGGGGADVAVYAGDRGDYTIDIDEGVVTISHDGGDEGVDTLTGVELARFADAIVSLSNGMVIASNDPDIWTGGAGDDVYVGLGGNDRLDGADGHDDLMGEDGDDTLIGGAGNDTLDGGADMDTADYSAASGGMEIDLDTDTADGGGLGVDDLSSIENVIGSAHDDFIGGHWNTNALSGGDGNDTLVGRYSDDTLLGGAGADILEGGEDNDVLDGGDGVDTARYFYAGAGVAVSLATGVGDAGELDQDTLTSIENLRGSTFNDTLTGDGGGNVVEGDLGDDSLSGGAGNDTIEGGDGSDTVVYSGALADYTVWGAGGVITVSHNGGGADGVDTLTTVEFLQFSDIAISLETGIMVGTAGDDAWSGSEGSDTYAGLAGDDTIAGGDGGDWLMGHDGNDWLSGGAGDDQLEGGADIDTADYADAEGPMEISLDDGEAFNEDQWDSLEDIENVVGSAFSDFIEGNGNENGLSGGNGDDTLLGGYGADTLLGGAGADILDGGESGDVLNGGDGVDTAGFLEGPPGVSVNLVTGEATDGGGGVDTLVSIENVIGSTGNDTLTGDGNANILEGGEGDDELDGGGGDDVVSYARAMGAVMVDVADAAAQAVGSGQGQDTLTDIEGLIGSDYNDTLSASSGSATLDGGAGNDRIVATPGSGETTRVNLGAGVDTLALGAGTAGVVVAADFVAGTGGDVLDLEDLLDGTDWDGVENPFEAGFLRLVQDEEDAVLAVDADGTGANLVHVLRLEGVNSLDLNASNLGFAPSGEVTGGAGDDIFDWTPVSPVESIFGGGGFGDLLRFFASTFEMILDTVTEALRGMVGALPVFFSGIAELFINSLSLVINGFLDGFGLSHDTIHYEGTPGDDNLLDASGMTSMHSIEANGLDGEDTLISAGGNDVLDGGTGADNLVAGGDNDTLTGGAGDDTLDGGAGGLDVGVFSGNRADYTVTVLGGGQVQVSGADGVDILSGIERLRFADTTTDGVGAALSSGGGGGGGGGGGPPPNATTDGADLISLGAAADSVNAGGGDDTVLAGEGADFVHGNAGDDSLMGGGGHDTLRGGQGSDRVFGEAGDDMLFGDKAENHLRGGEGNDALFGGDEFDDLHGNVGDDVVRGGAGGDWVVGGQGLDQLFGDDGADVVLGNLGEDNVAGGAGNDVVRGGQGNDVIHGDDGDDWLSGDRGADTLFGGAGADIFHSFAEAGTDRVEDFDYAAGDRVNLAAGSTYTVAQVGGDTVVTLTGGAELTLAGVQLSGLPEGWISVG